MPSLVRCTWSVAATLTLSTSALAALPEAGLWAFDGEVSGKPGRGIQIDRQGGETVIASYYGYRADGAAVFYQAVGKITDGKTFNAELIEYKGGTVIGGAVKDASEAKTIGPIQAVFNTAASGSVTLPGEQSKAFSRYVYEDHRKRLNNEFLVSAFSTETYRASDGLIRMRIETLGDELTIRIYTSKTDDSEYSLFTGPLIRDGSGFSSTGPLIRNGTVIATSVPVYMKFENLNVSDSGVLSGSVRNGQSPDAWEFQNMLLGMCYEERPRDDIDSPPTFCGPQRLGLTQR